MVVAVALAGHNPCGRGEACQEDVGVDCGAMGSWVLVVETPSKEHRIPLGADESVALRVLGEAKKHINQLGAVTIAERLALDASKIESVLIEETQLPR